MIRIFLLRTCDSKLAHKGSAKLILEHISPKARVWSPEILKIYVLHSKLSKLEYYVRLWEVSRIMDQIVDRKILHYLRKETKNTHWYVKKSHKLYNHS